MSLQDLESNEDRVALVVDGERVGYADLRSRLDVARARLAALGVGPGSRVAVLMPNSVAMIVTLLAAWENGAVVLPVNTRYRAHDLRYVLADSDVEVVVTCPPAPGAPDLVSRVSDAVPGAVPDVELDVADAPALRRVVTWPLPDGHGAPPRAAAAHAGDRLLVYTSGTTANPKGCVHDLAAFETTARQTAQSMRLGPDDVVWDPLPLFHTGGLLPLLGALQHGATFCTSAHFDAGDALRLMEVERVTVAYPAFSTLVADVLDDPDFPATDLGALRWILAIGPQGLLERVQREIPSAVQVSCYGCTEVGGVVVYHEVDAPAEQRATTAGTPFDGVEVSVVDPLTGEDVATGVTGEIAVRADSVLRRYHREERPPVDVRGRFRTGDLGRLDGHGDLVFEGRLKDMLKVGGENVAASEIEFVLASHDAVSLVAVVGAPDTRLEEVPAAFVELKPGHEATQEDLVRYCAERLAAFKVPREVHFVTTWPMSATKVQKFRLRQQLEEGRAMAQVRS